MIFYSFFFVLFLNHPSLYCNLLSHDMKTGNCRGKTGKRGKNEKTKRAGKYKNEEGMGWYGTGMKEGQERAGGEFFSVPAHIFCVNTQITRPKLPE